MADKGINWLGWLIIRNKLSLGRLSFWLVFIMSSVFWVQGTNAPEQLMTALMLLLTYNLGKKVRDVAQIYVENKSKQEDIE